MITDALLVRFRPDGRPLEVGPAIVGVLNVTPDSFSDGGKHSSPDDAVESAMQMVHAGAHWVDVGGESTRPGAAVLSQADECARVLPVIQALAARLNGQALISIDTYKAQTARAAVAAGAHIINDVSGGLMDSGLLPAAAQLGVPVVLGHMRGAPQTMMNEVHFEDVLAEVTHELAQRVAAARAAGCQHIWVDPGIGFGKRLAENLILLRHLPALMQAVGAPVMVGVSRKRFIGELTGQPVGARGYGTAAAVALAVAAGVHAVRVHDVGPTRDVVSVAMAISRAGTA